MKSLLERAFALDRAGREREAIPIYRQAIKMGLQKKHLSDAFLCLGSSLRSVGNYKEAIKTLKRGGRLFPHHVPMKTFLSFALYDKGKFKESYEVLVNALLESVKTREMKLYGKIIKRYSRAFKKGGRR